MRFFNPSLYPFTNFVPYFSHPPETKNIYSLSTNSWLNFLNDTTSSQYPNQEREFIECLLSLQGKDECILYIREVNKLYIGPTSQEDQKIYVPYSNYLFHLIVEGIKAYGIDSKAKNNPQQVFNYLFKACLSITTHSTLSTEEIATLWTQFETEGWLNFERESVEHQTILNQIKNAIIIEKIPFSHIKSWMNLLAFTLLPASASRFADNYLHSYHLNKIFNCSLTPYPMKDIEELKEYLNENKCPSVFNALYQEINASAPPDTIKLAFGDISNHEISRIAQEIENLWLREAQHPTFQWIGLKFFHSIKGATLSKEISERLELRFLTIAYNVWAANPDSSKSKIEKIFNEFCRLDPSIAAEIFTTYLVKNSMIHLVSNFNQLINSYKVAPAFQINHHDFHDFLGDFFRLSNQRIDEAQVQEFTESFIYLIEKIKEDKEENHSLFARDLLLQACQHSSLNVPPYSEKWIECIQELINKEPYLKDSTLEKISKNEFISKCSSVIQGDLIELINRLDSEGKCIEGLKKTLVSLFTYDSLSIDQEERWQRNFKEAIDHLKNFPDGTLLKKIDQFLHDPNFLLLTQINQVAWKGLILNYFNTSKNSNANPPITFSWTLYEKFLPLFIESEDSKKLDEFYALVAFNLSLSNVKPPLSILQNIPKNHQSILQYFSDHGQIQSITSFVNGMKKHKIQLKMQPNELALFILTTCQKEFFKEESSIPHSQIVSLFDLVPFNDLASQIRIDDRHLLIPKIISAFLQIDRSNDALNWIHLQKKMGIEIHTDQLSECVTHYLEKKDFKNAHLVLNFVSESQKNKSEVHILRALLLIDRINQPSPSIKEIAKLSLEIKLDSLEESLQKEMMNATSRVIKPLLSTKYSLHRQTIIFKLFKKYEIRDLKLLEDFLSSFEKTNENKSIFFEAHRYFINIPFPDEAEKLSLWMNCWRIYYQFVLSVKGDEFQQFFDHPESILLIFEPHEEHHPSISTIKEEFFQNILLRGIESLKFKPDDLWGQLLKCFFRNSQTTDYLYPIFLRMLEYSLNQLNSKTSKSSLIDLQLPAKMIHGILKSFNKNHSSDFKKPIHFFVKTAKNKFKKEKTENVINFIDQLIDFPLVFLPLAIDLFKEKFKSLIEKSDKDLNLIAQKTIDVFVAQTITETGIETNHQKRIDIFENKLSEILTITKDPIYIQSSDIFFKNFTGLILRTFYFVFQKKEYDFFKPALKNITSKLIKENEFDQVFQIVKTAFCDFSIYNQMLAISEDVKEQEEQIIFENVKEWLRELQEQKQTILEDDRAIFLNIYSEFTLFGKESIARYDRKTAEKYFSSFFSLLPHYIEFDNLSKLLEMMQKIIYTIKSTDDIKRLLVIHSIILEKLKEDPFFCVTQYNPETKNEEQVPCFLVLWGQTTHIVKKITEAEEYLDLSLPLELIQNITYLIASTYFKNGSPVNEKLQTISVSNQINYFSAHFSILRSKYYLDHAVAAGKKEPEKMTHLERIKTNYAKDLRQGLHTFQIFSIFNKEVVLNKEFQNALKLALLAINFPKNFSEIKVGEPIPKNIKRSDVDLWNISLLMPLKTVLAEQNSDSTYEFKIKKQLIAILRETLYISCFHQLQPEAEALFNSAHQLISGHLKLTETENSENIENLNQLKKEFKNKNIENNDLLIEQKKDLIETSNEKISPCFEKEVILKLIQNTKPLELPHAIDINFLDKTNRINDRIYSVLYFLERLPETDRLDVIKACIEYNILPFPLIDPIENALQYDYHQILENAPNSLTYIFAFAQTYNPSEKTNDQFYCFMYYLLFLNHFETSLYPLPADEQRVLREQYHDILYRGRKNKPSMDTTSSSSSSSSSSDP